MITLISGTNRPQSTSRAIVNLYASMLEQRGQAYQILDLADLPADFIQTALYENTGKNEQFNALASKIAASDKIVFVVPEYNSSFPGVLKAFIDGLAYPNTLKDKKGALIGLSSGMQGSGIALSHFSDVLNYLGMHVMAMRMKLAHIEKNFDGQQFTNKFYQELLEQHVEQFLKF